MRYAELTRRLRRLGCELLRQAKGGHEIWIDPRTGRRAVISRHGGQEIPAGTLRAILRNLDIDPAEFWE
jgi:predicted RNA binding protein YcfA (HicA-like mRNA interferase family)